MGEQGLREEALETSFGTLKMLGESLPRQMGDATLDADIDKMNETLQNTDDLSLLNLKESNERKYVILMRIYGLLGHHFHFSKTSLFWSTSLRMVQLSLMNGYCMMTPIAFAFYGEVLVSLGKFELANRLGGLYFAFDMT